MHSLSVYKGKYEVNGFDFCASAFGFICAVCVVGFVFKHGVVSFFQLTDSSTFDSNVVEVFAGDPWGALVGGQSPCSLAHAGHVGGESFIVGRYFCRQCSSTRALYRQV